MNAQSRLDVDHNTISVVACQTSDCGVAALATDATHAPRYVGKQKKLSTQDVNDLRSRYVSGEAELSSLAERYKIRIGVVRWHLESAGIPIRARKRKLSSDQIADALSSYEAGEVLHSIASRLNVDEGAVMHHVKRNGLRLRGRTGAPSKYTGNETHLHCPRCQQNLPLGEFGPQTNPRCKRPGSAVCKKCACERKTCKEYNISPERYRELQGIPRCAICKASFETSKRFIDHCHTTGHVRGVVCEFCNSGLGFSDDSTTRLQQIKSYLLREVSIPMTSHAGVVGDDLKQRRVRVYNIYPDQYTWLLGLCSNACHCCGAPFEEHRRKAPNIDHCHTTGNVRGLLCFACNIAVGKFRNSPEIIDAAIAYIGATP